MEKSRSAPFFAPEDRKRIKRSLPGRMAPLAKSRENISIGNSKGRTAVLARPISDVN
jgi:hypothetical protein